MIQNITPKTLFICTDSKNLKWKDVTRKKYQNTLQDFLQYTDYKGFLFFTYEEWSGGEETRKKSPYFLINVAAQEKELDT